MVDALNRHLQRAKLQADEPLHYCVASFVRCCKLNVHNEYASAF
jgi:hypothetical protein